MSFNDIAIRVQNLSKCYEIYKRSEDRLKQSLIPRLRRRLGSEPRNYYQEFWALRNISFEVRKGDAVGIIGQNGSGKSTLLQIICGTLAPTNGVVEINGRVAALLELGAGFNPEFTGRENVFMNATLLGLDHYEIESRFEQIAEFAGIGDFMSQPLKTYSTGMVVRLAFAVAVNVDANILVIDEAISVGDELFQRKCFSRVEAMKRNGATILFVSHSCAAVVELCNGAILIDAGEKLMAGDPKTVVGKYQRLLYSPTEKRFAIREEILSSVKEPPELATPSKEMRSFLTDEDRRVDATEGFFDPSLMPESTVRYEPQGAHIDSPKIFAESGNVVNCLRKGKTYRYTYNVRFESTATNVRFGMLIKTMTGIELGGVASAPSPSEAIPLVASGSSVNVEFQFRCALNPGTYFLNSGVVTSHNGEAETFLHRILDIHMFKVLPLNKNTSVGTVDFDGMARVHVYAPHPDKQSLGRIFDDVTDR